MSMNDSQQIWSFNWVTADYAGRVTRDRIYTEALPLGLRVWLARKPILDVNWTKSLRDRASRGQRIWVNVKSEFEKNTFVLTHHEFLDQQFVQFSLIQTGTAYQDDKGWADFLQHVSRVAPRTKLSRLIAIRQRALEFNRPTAYSARDFEGIMPNVEVVHQTIAAHYFCHRFEMNLAAPAWQSVDPEA